MTILLEELKLVKTPRREKYEQNSRFLLARADVELSDAEEFLNTKQAILNDASPLEMIYTGRYLQGVEAVEKFTESLTIEDL